MSRASSGWGARPRSAASSSGSAPSSVGLREGLRVCHDLLRPGGYLAFTEAVWRQENPPAEVRASFDLDYPTMGWAAEPEMHRRHAAFYAYEFFVARRPALR